MDATDAIFSDAGIYKNIILVVSQDEQWIYVDGEVQSRRYQPKEL